MQTQNTCPGIQKIVPATVPNAVPLSIRLTYAVPDPFRHELGRTSDALDAEEAIVWMANGLGPTTAEWAAIRERAFAEYADAMAGRADDRRDAPEIGAALVERDNPYPADSQAGGWWSAKRRIAPASATYGADEGEVA